MTHHVLRRDHSARFLEVSRRLRRQRLGFAVLPSGSAESYAVSRAFLIPAPKRWGHIVRYVSRTGPRSGTKDNRGVCVSSLRRLGRRIRVACEAFIYGVVVSAMIRDLLQALGLCLAVVSWTFYLPLGCSMRFLGRGGHIYSVAAFVVFSNRTVDALVTHTLLRSWVKGKVEPWTWEPKVRR